MLSRMTGIYTGFRSSKTQISQAMILNYRNEIPYLVKKITGSIFAALLSYVSVGQKLETTYLNPNDSTANTYVAIIPENTPIKAFLFLLNGFGGSVPKDGDNNR